MQRLQKILLQHALERALQHGIDAIDLTRVYEEAIRIDIEEILLGLQQGDDMAQEDAYLLAAFQAKRYFIDEDHPTPMGNRLAAGYLAEYLHHKGLVDLDLPSLRQEQRGVLRRDPGRFTFRMPQAPQDVPLAAYTFLLEQDIAEIRRVFEIGLKAASERKTRKRLCRAWGGIERARDYEEASTAAFRRTGIQYISCLVLFRPSGRTIRWSRPRSY